MLLTVSLDYGWGSCHLQLLRRIHARSWALNASLFCCVRSQRSRRLTYDELYSKLSQTKGHVDSKVLSHMIRFFAAEILLANQDILSDLYDSAKACPLSSTKASLREDEGLIFNGAFVTGTPSRCARLYLVLTPMLHIHMACVHIASTLHRHCAHQLCACFVLYMHFPFLCMLAGLCC